MSSPENNQPIHRVFVYGTLKRGFPNHHYMQGATFIAPAVTVARYPLLVGGHGFTPYLLPEPDTGHRIKGEVWEVPEHMMPALDQLEAVHLPTGYRRTAIDVVAEGQLAVTKAWTYFRERRHIAIIHTDMMDDYQDRRYISADDRDV